MTERTILVLEDGFNIRRAATEKQIPYFTSLDTDPIAVEAILNGSKSYNVKPFPEYRRKEPA